MWDTPDNAEIQKIAVTIYEEQNGVVGAVCHGPCGIVNTKLSDGKYLVEGKKVTGFSNAEEEAVQLTEVMPFLLESKLKERGAIYSAAPNWAPHVVVDNRLATGQNPASATPLAEAMVKMLPSHL
jgi:putative intracellular protease/amidase